MLNKQSLRSNIWDNNLKRSIEKNKCVKRLRDTVNKERKKRSREMYGRFRNR